MKEPVVKIGDLLIASGTLVDPSFHQTVVLICSHDVKLGTYGLVLNRPLRTDGPVIEKLPFIVGRLFRGGPVQSDTMQILHPYGRQSSDTLRILPRLWIGGDFDELEVGFRSGVYDPAECRFFLGYSGWDAGQLRDEFESGSWLRTRASHSLIYDTPTRQLWSEAVRACSGTDPLFANFPENPSWN